MTAPYGLLAEFAGADALIRAVRHARAEGYRRIETYTPFPIEGVEEAIGFRENRIAGLCLAGGLSGSALGFLMQVYVNLDFPINVGGRALIAVPAFLVVTFELIILFAVLFAVFGMLALNRLPRLHHPLFDAERFRLASLDRFFLCVRGDDPRFDPKYTADFLQQLAPVTIVQVPE